MIVISGALVPVAIVLLLVGLVSDGLGFVWASIAVSALSAIFLGIGVYQRRTLQPEATTLPTVRPEDDAVRMVTPVPDAPTGTRPSGATVYVIPGRPRYHLEGCRYLANREYEPREIGVAVAEGFQSCGVCRPEASLAEVPDAEPQEPVPADVAPEDEAVAAPVARTPRRTAATTRSPRAAKAPARAPARAPAKIAATATRTAAGAPAKKAAGKKVVAAKRTAPIVIAVPDRGKFHTPDCRFAQSAGAEESTKATARRQGLVACGVCKP